MLSQKDAVVAPLATWSKALHPHRILEDHLSAGLKPELGAKDRNTHSKNVLFLSSAQCLNF